MVGQVIASINEKFKLNNLDSLNYFLGMEFSTGDDYLLLNKKTYVQELIVKVDMSNDNPFPTPITGTCIKHTGYGYMY